jgi:hypothetical protein
MNLADKLRRFAKKLETEADEVLAEAQDSNPQAFEQIVSAVAMSSAVLEKTADSLEEDGQAATISIRLVEQLAATAEALDQSEDPALQKQASVLDELLVTLSAPKGAVAQAKKANEDELNRLREEYRTKAREDLYSRAREALRKQNRTDKVRKAVETKVEPYRPMQGSLSTRYPPDMPGGHLTRISDGVYQDITTGKIYNYHSGYTTNKGNQIPGTSVQNQTRDLGDDRMGHAIFNTRENIMARFASLDDESLRALAEATLTDEELRKLADGCACDDCADCPDCADCDCAKCRDKSDLRLQEPPSSTKPRPGDEDEPPKMPYRPGEAPPEPPGYEKPRIPGQQPLPPAQPAPRPPVPPVGPEPEPQPPTTAPPAKEPPRLPIDPSQRPVPTHKIGL